ncbi:MAG: PEP-CTERM sorting domain-containing protein [Desulfobacterales bacterium]|nr:PEP-CTERM sorting domain-containing protein [Desulfobacterales bacterium]
MDPKLFGTNAAGTGVDYVVATPGLFDANSTTRSGAFGFLSLGDGGRISFNLSSAASSLGGLYLYIGEVGDNGELAAGRIEVSDKPVPVPEPASLILIGLGLLGLTGVRRKQKA